MAEKTHQYFRYSPGDNAPGFNSLIGDVEPGGIYEVPPHLVDRFENHPDWEAASKTAFDKQND